MKRIALLLIIMLALTSCTPQNIKRYNDINNDDTSTLKEQENQTNDENENSENVVELKITRHPSPQNLKKCFDLKELPKYDENANWVWQVDLRSGDLSTWDVSDRLYDLMNSLFDSQTIWPIELPKGFDPDKIMEIGKNPGLNIRSLHNEGITGKGVGIAIIDYALLVDHVEYKDRLKMYEEIHHSSKRAHFHGPGVASLVVGKTTGVAPEADLYFIASQNYESSKKEKKLITNFSYTAQCIERIIDLNKSLENDKKIRAISISSAWNPEKSNGYEEMVKAIEKANDEGIFVISCSLPQYNEKFHFHGLAREPMKDPDDFESYSIIPWDKWISKVNHVDDYDEFYASEFDKIKEKQVLAVPIDSRAIAGSSGNDDYVFYREGGWSWAVPYIAGLYVLSCQVKPDITPEIFWDEAYNTGIAREIEKDGSKYETRIINPVDLMKRLEELE
ncbi:S8 family serine peptidase [Abyssisolibacter fermentans]|uniref:S8 family serine peptidase n=1 Tax=Abyssisolibacter fermentans TaxID=1766203 RepID=UPI0008322B9A|nr:S8 family serine peptidase [Abyssisolibacter fermentans]